MPIQKFQKINGNVLKIVAIVTMLIDHIAAAAILPVVVNGHYHGTMSIAQLNKVYYAMRCIGRWAFPIFCYLLVEGFTHTKSKLKYALSLLCFGLVSEIPFDIAFYADNDPCNPNVLEVISANWPGFLEQSNVYFTLFFGLLVIWAIDTSFAFIREKQLPTELTMISCAFFTLVGSVITYKLNTDYDYRGIVIIVIFYILRKHRGLAILTGYMFICTMYLEHMSFPGFILMALYSTKRGRNLGKLKYIFYVFYPVHLILIYIFRCMYAMQ